MIDVGLETFQAPDPRSSATAPEARRQRRICCCRQAWAVPINDPTQHHSVVIHDISTIGAGFVSAHQFPTGTWLLLTISFPAGELRKVLCFTRRCQQLENGLSHTGTEFEAAVPVDGPSDEIPQAWLEWVFEQEGRHGRPLGGPVLEPDLVAGCGTEEVESY